MSELLGEADLAEVDGPLVVAAIVTSDLGVLIGKRADGRPPWAFVAGKVEPGESVAEAAVREVAEEAGLVVTAGLEIGRRVHPETGRPLVYLTCRPTEGTDARVGSKDELTEVRWVGLDAVDELLPDMFKPARDHLQTVLG